jgi:hypothetical protein
MPRLIACLPSAAALALGGCVTPENDRITVDQDLRLEAFAPVPPSTTPPPMPPAPPPSVVSVDRSNWARITLLAPVDGAAHRPTYTKRLVLTDQTARQRRQYPTALTALETTGGSETWQQLEAPANWLVSAGDILLFPIRVLWQAPWGTRWSPDEAYARYWHPEHPEPPPPPETPSPAGQPMPPVPPPITPPPIPVTP